MSRPDRAGLYSFDVFDTLVIRPYTQPADLFRVLAADVLGAGATGGDHDDFVAARMGAERRARDAARGRDDIPLDAIYAEFSRSTPFARFAAAAREREVALELESVVPVRVGVDAVRARQAEGCRVVFLSDMYLPVGVIAAMLRGAGIAAGEDAIYVSGATGASKHTGRMYDLVAEREGVAPARCRHTGDNWHADVLRARQRGWQATLFAEPVLNRFEAPDGRGPHWPATRAGGVSRAARLACASGNADAALLAADVVGPLLAAFACDVLLDAQARGIDTLYFVSRDGQVLLAVARALQAAGIAPRLQLRYLYGSRQAWFLPSVFAARREHLAWAAPRGLAATPRDILRRLELGVDEVPGLAADGIRPDVALSPDAANDFLDRIAASPAAALLVERAAARRRVLLAYLASEGLLDAGRRAALVDVGWTLKTQAALHRCLQAAGHNGDLPGYYLGAVADHEPLAQSGPARALVAASGAAVPSRLRADWFFRMTTIQVIEHLFTLADHASVTGYRAEGDGVVPVLGRDERDAAVRAFTADLHAELVAFAGFAARRLGTELADPGYLAWSLENVRRFVREPRADEVARVAWLPTNREQGHDARHGARLASPLGLRDLWHMARHDLRASGERHFAPAYAWNEGAVALSPWHVRATFALLRLARQFLHRDGKE